MELVLGSGCDHEARVIAEPVPVKALWTERDSQWLDHQASVGLAELALKQVPHIPNISIRLTGLVLGVALLIVIFIRLELRPLDT